jgi:hypothetical protein
LAKQEIYQLKKIINNPSFNKRYSAENEKNTATEINDELRETLAKQFGILNRIALLENTLPTCELRGTSRKQPGNIFRMDCCSCFDPCSSTNVRMRKEFILLCFILFYKGYWNNQFFCVPLSNLKRIIQQKITK